MASQTHSKNMFTALALEDFEDTTLVKETPEAKQDTKEAMQQITGSTTATVTKSKLTLPQPKKFTKPSIKEEKKPSLDEILAEEAHVRSVKKGPVKRGSISSIPDLPSLDDYPALGAELTKNQAKIIAQANVAKQLAEPAVSSDRLDARSASFAAMADKEKVAKSLKCTKACRNVTGPMTNPKEGEEPKFGVCTREMCTFAHSMEELQLPICGFDGTCRYVHGKRDHKTKQKIPGTKCKYYHSFELIEEWITRTGVDRPNLPPTNEHSRKPSKSKNNSAPSTPAKSQIKVQAPPKAPTKAPKKKRVWGPPVGLDNEAEKAPVQEKLSRRKYESSDSSDSESDYKHRSRRLHSRSSKSNSQVIRVPTKELAEIAIQAAFDRGQYNIQVIVE